MARVHSIALVELLRIALLEGLRTVLVVARRTGAAPHNTLAAASLEERTRLVGSGTLATAATAVGLA